MKTICVYCGSADNLHPEYVQAARQMGRAIAEHGLRLIYGAGRTGLMGAVADGALENGGEVYGIMPAMFNTPQLVHASLTSLEIVDTIHQRKARMAELSDAFIALPGGYGTFEELFEILTWAQIGLHHNPVGLLNVRSYFDPLLKMVDHAQREGFIYREHQVLLTYANEPGTLLAALEHYQPPNGLERWLERPG